MWRSSHECRRDTLQRHEGDCDQCQTPRCCSRSASTSGAVQNVLPDFSGRREDLGVHNDGSRATASDYVTAMIPAQEEGTVVEYHFRDHRHLRRSERRHSHTAPDDAANPNLPFNTIVGLTPVLIDDQDDYSDFGFLANRDRPRTTPQPDNGSRPSQWGPTAIQETPAPSARLPKTTHQETAFSPSSQA